MKNLIKPETKHFIFRNQAKVFENIIVKKFKKSNDSKLVLDFSEVYFISRSFADELLKIIDYFKEKNKTIKIINKNPYIQCLFRAVETRRKK